MLIGKAHAEKSLLSSNFYLKAAYWLANMSHRKLLLKLLRKTPPQVEMR